LGIEEKNREEIIMNLGREEKRRKDRRRGTERVDRILFLVVVDVLLNPSSDLA